MASCFLALALLAVSFIGTNAVIIFGDRVFDGSGHVVIGGFQTRPDLVWCRRHCFFRPPFGWRSYCARYCFRVPGQPSFLAEPACGKLALWQEKDSCEGIVNRYGLDKAAFKTLNPWFPEECDGKKHADWAGLMACVKDIAPGEERQPLMCQKFHAVCDDHSFDSIGALYGKTGDELAALNPTINRLEKLPDHLILCIERDSNRLFPAPCDLFYDFKADDKPQDCRAVINRFIPEVVRTLEEFNAMNPDHPCDPKAPMKYVPGEMLCLREPRDLIELSGAGKINTA